MTIARIRQESSEGEGVACMTDYLKQHVFVNQNTQPRVALATGVFDLVSKHISMNEGQMDQKQVSHSSHSLMMIKKRTKNFSIWQKCMLKRSMGTANNTSKKLVPSRHELIQNAHILCIFLN